MIPSSNQWLWVAWIVLNLVGAGALVYKVWPAKDKTVFLPGETTHGHYQIEMDCDACHTPFLGVKQDACIQCHGEELERSQDAHPPSKFSDPTATHLREHIQADKCIACHTEHNPDATHSMGVTLPTDYCAFCHEDVGENRASHKGLGFDTCASAGCHNFHDNRALYERFLQDHVDEPKNLETQIVPPRKEPRSMGKTLLATDQDAPSAEKATDEIVQSWLMDVHAKQGVNCSDCHQAPVDGSTKGQTKWIDKPGVQQCQTCHDQEVETWGLGRHGMRFAAGLGHMTPEEARQPMHAGVHSTMDCNACHKAHSYDTKWASVDACLQCHSDPHSLAFKSSPHFDLWEQELAGELPAGSGVSCATCHMPRIEDDDGNIFVQHNQNDNLRPNEKMIRSSCINCHGVGFSINALADEGLKADCYSRSPEITVETMDWVKTRMAEIEARRKRAEERRKEREKNRNKPEINEDDL